MLRVNGSVVTVVLLMIGCIATGAGASAPSNLREALEEAIARDVQAGGMQGSATQPGDDAVDSGSAGWLAMPPVFSASYLASDQSWGTDETELSLSLPFLSPAQRRINSRLKNVDPALTEASDRYRRWRLSGTLRELHARYRQVELHLELAVTESDEMEALQRWADPLVAAGSISAFDAWLIGQRARDARTQVARLTAESQTLQRRFAELTGLSGFPESAQDAAPVPSSIRYHEHPEALYLDALLAQQLAANEAGSTRLTPWTLGVVGRELAVPSMREWQYGLAVSIPITLGTRESLAVRSSERALRRQHAIQMDTWRTALRLRWDAAWARRQALAAEAQLLVSTEIGLQLQRNLELVRQDTEMPIENRVLRRLELLRAVARPALLQAEIAAVEAELRQLAGSSL